jgi:hypothetical protein
MFKITEMTSINGGAFTTYAAFDSTGAEEMTVDDTDYYVYDGSAFTTYDITVFDSDTTTFLVGD